MIGWAVAAISMFATDASTGLSASSVARVPDSLPFPGAAVDSSARVADSDSVAASVARDSVPPDTLREFAFDSTVVKGVRRRRLDVPVDRAVWSRPSSMGLPGAVESLREQPGVAFSSDLSGHFSSTGMPVEGSAITWNGAEILWPWHFGGLFGALDDWATGRVAWHNPPGTPSPSRGGGWLETEGRAGGDSDQVHAAARLGFVAGGAATWGRRGDWGWQATARRTWLDWALDLARDRKWTDQRMKVLFQDATTQATWNHGPWKASVGWFGSEDTLGIATNGKKDSLMGLSWQNIAIPVGLSWREGSWEAQAQGSWSRYRRLDSDFHSSDTLGLWRGMLAVGRNLSEATLLEAGFKAERWSSLHRQDDSWASREWVGDSNRTVLEPTLRMRYAKWAWESEAWMGLVHAEHDEAVPEGAIKVGWNGGVWEVQASVERKWVALSILDQAQEQIDAASPASILPPGSAPRTTQIQLQVGRKEFDPASETRTELGVLGWYRLDQGFWNWSPVYDRLMWITRYQAARSDGWGTGVEIDGSLGGRRWDLSGRQILSMDVLRDTGRGPDRPPSRWAPWDQRWRTEFRAAFACKGAIRPAAGEFYWHSELVGKMSSGLLRTKFAAWTFPNQDQEIDTVVLGGSSTTRAKDRTPYFRLDVTPLRIGREGRWAFWWTLVNVTNAANLMGWVDNGPDDPAQPVSQIPFLPVVFGVQVEI